MHTLAEAGNEPRSAVALSEIQNNFYLHRTAIGNCVFDALVAGRYYTRRPDLVRLLYVASAIIIGLLMVLLGFVLAATGRLSQSWIASGVLTSIIILGFGWYMPARSMIGVLALAKVRGFATFLLLDNDSLSESRLELRLQPFLGV